MLLKCILLTALLVAVSCATTSNHKKNFLKGSSSTHDLVTRQTDWASDGTGDVDYLARHYIDCKSDKAGAVASFQLKRDKENDQIRFEYQCSQVSNIDWDTCVDSTTEASSGSQKTSAQLLVGQSVQCDAYSVLTAFGLQTTTDGSNQVRYRYTCCRASTGPCAKDVTSTEQLASGNTVDLDSQTVAASNGNVLTGFVLTSETSEDGVVSAAYKFNYCGAQQDVVRRETSSQTHGDNEIIYLDRHNVDCKSSKSGAISRFHVQRQGGSNINYEYECTNAQSIDWDKCTSKTNGWTDLGSDNKKSLQFLDRQNVQCDAGTVLTQFKFNTNSPSYNKVRYSYTCCPAVLDNCSTANSSIQDIDQGYVVYLDRQNIKAKTGGVMTGFQFQAQYPGGHMTGNYRVNSCLAR